MNRRIFAGIVLFALLCAMLTGCGGREKVDLNGAASLADLRGATLGAQTGTFHLQALEQVEGVTKKDYADFTDLLNALRSGAIDGYVAEEPTALEVCGKDDTLTYLPFRNNENGFTATDEETGIAAAFRTGSDMTAQVNAILADIPQQTRQELMAQIVAMSADPDTERSEAPVLDASGSTENGVSASPWNAPTRRSTGRRPRRPTAPSPFRVRTACTRTAMTCRSQSTSPRSSAWRWRSMPIPGIR